LCISMTVDGSEKAFTQAQKAPKVLRLSLTRKKHFCYNMNELTTKTTTTYC